MGCDGAELVEKIIAYWGEERGSLSEEDRRTCREAIFGIAQSTPASELLECQEAPRENRWKIWGLVEEWLARGAPSRGVAREKGGSHRSPELTPAPDSPLHSTPPGSQFNISNNQQGDGGVIQGVGSVQGDFHWGTRAFEGRSKAETLHLDRPQRARILFVGASPTNADPLRLDEEVREIERSLQSAELGSLFELHQKWAVRVAEMQDHLLRTKPQVLHFSGHGIRQAILLLRDDGSGRPVEAASLTRVLANFSPRLRCVVLNACYSEATADRLAEHVDCVVGMTSAVADRAAIRFAAVFYKAVASGCSIKAAVDHACADIELGELRQSEVPRLLARRCNPAEVVLCTAR